MKPVIALVGRPNVGKSTLFNRLTRSRDALVADLPGLTRDRHYGEGRVGDRPYLVVDTGGFEPVAKDGILHEMARQTRQAVEEADVVVFIVDGRNGLAPQDKAIADYLRKTGRPLFLVVNKAEGMKYSAVAADFYELGLGDPRAISAAHGDGVTEMIGDALEIAYAGQPEEDDEEKAKHGVKIAIVGRPNVGKSTLVNTLIGEERVIAFDMPGTTRDSIYVDFERQGRKYTLIDTAGLRRRGKVFEAIEKFSVVKTLQSISDANVVILLLDAQQDISEQDAHIAGFVVEQGRALVVGVNKWDGLDSHVRERTKADLDAQAQVPGLCQIPLHLGAGEDGYRPVDEVGRRCLRRGDGQVADAEAHARAHRRSGIPAAAPARPGAPEAALCAPGRAKSADHRHAWQRARRDHRHL